MRNLVVLVHHEAGLDCFEFQTRSNDAKEINVHVKEIVEARLGKVETKIDIRESVSRYVWA